MRNYLALGVLLPIAACTGLGTNIQSAAVKVQPELNAACATAMTLAPFAGPYAPFIIAGCGSAEGLAKLAADPNSAQWVDSMVVKVKATLPAKMQGSN